ncbi:hypothetical protein V3C99_015461 [Haemonchus contortus]
MRKVVEFDCKIIGTTVTPETRKRSVILANAYRTMASAGGYGYPPSKNMYQVGYSCKVEEYAMVQCSQLPAPTHPIK